MCPDKDTQFAGAATLRSIAEMIEDQTTGQGVRKSRRGLRPEPQGTLEQRAAERRKRIVGHYAKDFDDAEKWDLEFWQKETPQQRLSALVAIHNDIVAVRGNDPDFDWDY